ncbi:MAG: twin-arginine translocase TatA/TatE family subunit [Candidatus Brocadiales bacterium]
MPGGWEWIVILIVALLIFGKRLPDVMRSLGKGIVEFKKGVKGIEEDVDKASADEAKKRLEEESQKKEG